MSGPLAASDTEQASTTGPADGRQRLVLDSRTAAVGALTVRRALPQRSRRTVGAWCFLDHGGPVEAPAGAFGIGPHPHIGLRTVTWVLRGAFLHRDSLGSEQLVRPGELNLMTAGHGIVHAEEHPEAGPLHVVQLWVAQPAATRDGPSAFEHHGALPRLALGAGVATVLVGSLGDAASPARRDTDHMAADVELAGEVVLPADPAYEHAVVPVEGALQVDGAAVEPGRLVYLGPGRDELVLRSSGPARAIVVGGVPFDEPVVMWWNYVARTRDEIVEAHRAWTARDGRFVVPDSVLAPLDAGPPPWAGAS
ncbi:MAG TPA: pirin family protein [Acidimicrobiales bacterium]|nr:pirin family protein [Acidimicrobiales bacterium]